METFGVTLRIIDSNAFVHPYIPAQTMYCKLRSVIYLVKYFTRFNVFDAILSYCDTTTHWKLSASFHAYEAWHI